MPLTSQVIVTVLSLGSCATYWKMYTDERFIKSVRFAACVSDDMPYVRQPY